MKLAALVLALSTLSFRVAADESVSVTGADITEFGIYKVEDVKNIATSGAGSATNEGLDSFTLVRETTIIPALVGTRFGFRYAIHGTPSNTPIILTHVAEHPELKDPKTGKTQTRDEYMFMSRIGQTYSWYSFEKDWQLIPGVWKLEVWYERRKLCEQTFTVVSVPLSRSTSPARSGSGRHVKREMTPTATLLIVAFLVGWSFFLIRPIRKKIVEDTPHCTLGQIPAVFERLKQEGKDGSFAVFMFQPPDSSKVDDAVNIQFSIEDGHVGLDWCLIGPTNIRDQKKLEQFAASLGYAVRQLEMNETMYLRIEQGDLPSLCRKVIIELYAQEPDAKLDLVAEGFSWP